MIYKDPRDQVVDDAAIKALIDVYGERAAGLPPVAIVIAAYNEEGAIGPVIKALPAEVCGLPADTIVVADGCADSTAAEAAEAGAMVADVPVNRGQGAALRLGYRIAREGGAAYIITTDADGQYNPAEMATVLAPVVASLTVSSAQPSATTIVSVASPHTCLGSPSITGPIAPASL